MPKKTKKSEREDKQFINPQKRINNHNKPSKGFPSSWEIARPEGALATEGTQDRLGVEGIFIFHNL